MRTLRSLIATCLLAFSCVVFAGVSHAADHAALNNILPCRGSYNCGNTEVVKTLPSSGTLTEDFRDNLLPLVIRTMLYGLAGVSFVMFTIAGVMYAFGEEGQMKKARSMLIYGLMGAGFTASAYIIVRSILNII